ncbi:hypothetical protein BOTBODRAFT_99899 [Botryobasidium botryosum FD-172 SS1]|uniref:SET domain-containing protein n=1 Tax=Botryobasidium botryosum (strain FD-172 SS1) TaxID=930990 RepID=A0A067NBJ1_BOTB1|nr:hypothetical protein BOTBODRAFT_99899 [Botryobasidium botryosum FD-172 SS1]
MADDLNTRFLEWFMSHGGKVELAAVGLTHFPDAGRGAVALRDIQENEIIFSIPRDLLLSTRTCTLRTELGENAWKKLGNGWAGLMLCMMWENAKGASSKWAGYFEIMPNTFHSLMFWTPDELSELTGSTVLDKIGKNEAEKDYHERVVPILKDRPDLFPPSHLDSHYGLNMYHIMGSRILSRSFHVEEWKGNHSDSDDEEEHEEDGGEEQPEVVVPAERPASEDKMAVDGENTIEPHPHTLEADDEEDDEAEDVSDVSMVPMADMLNARNGCDNANLFYEEHILEMRATKPIKSGEQIWNTYGDPPNSDLLRRYGHVDMLTLPDGSIGNPSDVVEITADLVVDIVASEHSRERIDWWLEEGGDDVFIMEANSPLPDALVSLIRLLLSTSDEWEKIRDKGKPPKPKSDAQSDSVAEKVLRKRLDMYKTSLDDDICLLSSGSTPLSSNYQNAVLVRMGEKRILEGALGKLVEKAKAGSQTQTAGGKKRRAANGREGEASNGKRSKRS